MSIKNSSGRLAFNRSVDVTSEPIPGEIVIQLNKNSTQLSIVDASAGVRVINNTPEQTESFEAITINADFISSTPDIEQVISGTVYYFDEDGVNKNVTDVAVDLLAGNQVIKRLMWSSGDFTVDVDSGDFSVKIGSIYGAEISYRMRITVDGRIETVYLNDGAKYTTPSIEPDMGTALYQIETAGKAEFIYSPFYAFPEHNRVLHVVEGQYTANSRELNTENNTLGNARYAGFSVPNYNGAKGAIIAADYDPDTEEYVYLFLRYSRSYKKVYILCVYYNAALGVTNILYNNYWLTTTSYSDVKNLHGVVSVRDKKARFYFINGTTTVDVALSLDYNNYTSSVIALPTAPTWYTGNISSFPNTGHMILTFGKPFTGEGVLFSPVNYYTGEKQTLILNANYKGTQSKSHSIRPLLSHSINYPSFSVNKATGLIYLPGVFNANTAYVKNHDNTGSSEFASGGYELCSMVSDMTVGGTMGAAIIKDSNGYRRVATWHYENYNIIYTVYIHNAVGTYLSMWLDNGVLFLASSKGLEMYKYPYIAA